MAFWDRLDELAWLDEGWTSGKAELRVLYGRRGIGKTSLLDRFAAGQRRVVFQAAEGTVADHLGGLTDAILACQDDPVLREEPLPTWAAALAYLARMATGRQLLVVFDGYQHVAAADPTLAVRLQRWWLRHAMQLPIYLMLCGGPARSFMEHVLAGPLDGCHTGALQLQPLGYGAAASFFPSWSREDLVRAYAVVGGVPSYLLQCDPGRSLAWNIQQRVLRPGEMLYHEADRLVREEAGELRSYLAILRAIGGGATRLSRIAEQVTAVVGVDDLPSYLSVLQAAGLVEQRRSAGRDSGRRGIWIVADPYLRFWLRCVLPHRTQLEAGASAEHVYRMAVGPALDRVVAPSTFEEICRAWVLDQGTRGEWAGVDSVGAWWGPIPDPRPGQPRRQAEGEIAVVAMAGDRVAVAGAATWMPETVGIGALERLRRAGPHVPGVDARTELLLFGRSFDRRLVAAAESEGIRLVSVDDLYA